MDSVTEIKVHQSLTFVENFKAFCELLKFRLTATVVFSGCFGYIIAGYGPIDFVKLTWFVIGAFLATSSANIINQIIERNSDKFMKRTCQRPLPTGRISVSLAITYALVLGILGLGFLILKVNFLAAFLTFISMMLYGLVYTPLKKITPFCVLVGAFPGAFPPLIGWVASVNEITTQALVLFGIQFVWQFPHFWAIAWVLDDDYKKAGLKMLPSKTGRDINTAFQIMIYTLFLIPLSLLPTKFGITGTNSAIVITVCGVLFLVQTFALMKHGTQEAAKKIMFGSFLYLPIVQIAMILDKI